MNKFTKLILTSAVAATSGFATQLRISSDTTFESGTNVTLENGTSYVFSNGITLYNSTTIQGPTTEGESADFKMENDIGTARVVNSKDQLKLNSNFIKYSDETLQGDYYTPEALGKITGNIAIAEGVKVTGATIDLIEGGVLQTLGATDVAALIGDDADSMSMINSSDSSLTITQNIANEKTAENEQESKSLMIKGKFNFTGDQSHFTEKVVNVSDSEITFSGAKSLFQTDMEFANSTVNIEHYQPVSFGKSILVIGGKLTINWGTKFTLSSGGSLILGSPVYGWNYPNIATWNVGETSEIDGKVIQHNTIISNIKKYSNESGLTEEDFVLTSNGHYRGIKYSDGIFSYLGTNEESDAEMPGMEKGTTNPEKITKYIRTHADLVYTGKKDEVRTTSYNGGSSPHIITNDDGSTFQMFSITYDSSKEYYDFHLTGNHTGFSFKNFEGNDDIGYYYNTYQAFGGSWRIDKAIFWYFNEWDGVEGAVTE